MTTPPSATDGRPGVARLETSADDPVPVRVVALRIGEWIARLGEIWVDGQVAQLSRRPGMATQFVTLRDPDANISLSVTCPRGVLPDSVVEGARVVLRGRPDFWLERGTLSLRALEIRPVGLGELLARLEALKRLLAAEGLFAADRKRPLPFLPATIGLVTGRASAAERDVVENTRRRLPGARFRLENVAVQGVNAVAEIVAALERLDHDPAVDVVVVARGGGGRRGPAAVQQRGARPRRRRRCGPRSSARSATRRTCRCSTSSPTWPPPPRPTPRGGSSRTWPRSCRRSPSCAAAPARRCTPGCSARPS